MSELTINVDDDIAQAFSKAPPEIQQKIQALVNLWLRDLTLTSSRPLNEVMDEISEKAESRGLTSEILDAILQDK